MRKTIIIGILALFSFGCSPHSMNCETDCTGVCSSFFGEFGGEIGGWFGNLWDHIAGNCTETCSVKLRFVGQNGQPLSNVCDARVGMLLNIKLPNGQQKTLINGSISVNSGGMSSPVSIDCIDISDVGGISVVTPIAGSASFFARDPNCPVNPAFPANCAMYVMVAANPQVGFDKSDCSVVLTMQMVPVGSCISCPC